MAKTIIRKQDPEPRLPEPETAWEAARARLAGLPGGGLNIAHEALDRHIEAGHGEETAIIWCGKDGERQVLSYADLAGEAARFANLLQAHGIEAGETLFLLAGRVPALYAATLGALKA
ncbi:MAG: AMP-binding protein, partial [Salinarimonas sp.]